MTLRRKTAFVIGAGASHEFNLPTGIDLAKQISKKLDVTFDRWGTELQSGDGDLFRNITMSRQNERQEYQHAAWFIRDGITLAHSIDDFLQVHQDDDRVVRYGKAAIAKCILEAESNSLLLSGTKSFYERAGVDKINSNACIDTWLVKLMRTLVRGLARTECKQVFHDASFIIFNYDRCIERFFVDALQSFYRVDRAGAEEIVWSGNFIHPYGVAGNLYGSHGQELVRFGSERANYVEIGDNLIKTYSESVQSEKAREAVRAAEVIVFLGFAFHDQNMALLVENGTLNETKNFYGTAYQRSESDVQVIKRQIQGWFEPSMQRLIPDFVALDTRLTANAMFDYYSKTF